MIAIHQTALTVYSQHAVGIAIESKAHLSAVLHDGLAQGLQVGAAAADVDGRSIGLAVQGNDLSTKTAEQRLRAGGG